MMYLIKLHDDVEGEVKETIGDDHRPAICQESHKQTRTGGRRESLASPCSSIRGRLNRKCTLLQVNQEVARQCTVIESNRHN